MHYLTTKSLRQIHYFEAYMFFIVNSKFSHLSVMVSVQDVATVTPTAEARDAWMAETSLQSQKKTTNTFSVSPAQKYNLKDTTSCFYS